MDITRWSIAKSDWLYSLHSKMEKLYQFSSVQSLIESDTLWPHGLQHARHPCPSPTRRLLIFMSTESVMPFNHLILCQLFSYCLQSFSATGSLPVSQFFTSGGQSTETSASASVLAVQGTLKSHLQHHSSKASILQHSAFFMVQLSHPYMTTEKTIALTIWIFVSKMMALLFNILSRFVVTILPSIKCLLTSWLQSLSSDFGAQEDEIWHCFHIFPIYLPRSERTGCHDLRFF